MSIKLKEVSVQVAKELDEVFLMLNEVIRLVKAGEPLTNALDELIVAIDGVSEVPQGFQENLLASLRTVSLRTADTVELLLRPKAVAGPTVRVKAEVEPPKPVDVSTLPADEQAELAKAK